MSPGAGDIKWLFIEAESLTKPTHTEKGIHRLISSFLIGGEMFFNNWAMVGRTVVVGTLAYLSIVILLRISGKRTLSKMNAFDLVVCQTYFDG